MDNIIRFANPQAFYLLLVIVPMVVYYIWVRLRRPVSVSVSTVAGVAGVPRGLKYYLRHLPFLLRVLAVAAVVVAIARPQTSEDNQNVSTEGIDIVIAFDVSSSMLAKDFKPDRLVAAKEMASRFILDRPTDRIGLVVFAGESFTQSPLTTDHVSLVNLLSQVESGIIEDGTAIGNGLATAVSRLKESDAASKVIILLTDGVNNSGQVAPLTAAEIAKTYGIKVYTIGVGTEGVAPYPAMDMWGRMTYVQMKVEIDEKVMTEIADMTGGKYYRATDNDKLAEIYDQINALEKSKVDVENFVRYYDDFAPLVLLALGLLVCELLFRYFVLRQIP